MEAEVTKKVWDDPQLDAAQFAIDRFLNAKQTVSDKMSDCLSEEFLNHMNHL